MAAWEGEGAVFYESPPSNGQMSEQLGAFDEPLPRFNGVPLISQILGTNRIHLQSPEVKRAPSTLQCALQEQGPASALYRLQGLNDELHA